MKGGFDGMRATGIVRRMSEEHGVIIPKDVRKSLGIKEGELFEIFTDREGEIVLKVYRPEEKEGKEDVPDCHS